MEHSIACDNSDSRDNADCAACAAETRRFFLDYQREVLRAPYAEQLRDAGRGHLLNPLEVD